VVLEREEIEFSCPSRELAFATCPGVVFSECCNFWCLNESNFL